MVAHLDAVTSLAVDVNGLYLISGSKYKSILEFIGRVFEYHKSIPD